MSAHNEKLAPAAPPEAVSVLERLGEGARDALTDEMVGRLAETVSGGMTLLDQLNRSGLDQALPVLARMVESGDLERLAQLARLVGSAQDALTDEMVGRLAEMVSGGMTLLDKANRAGVDHAISLLERLTSRLTPAMVDKIADRLPRLLEALERLEQQHLLEDMLQSLVNAGQDAGRLPAPKGGLGGLWTLVKQRDTQETLQFFALFGKHFRSARTGKHNK